MSEQSTMIVWLDAFERLGEIELARLAEAGLRAVPARSIADIESLAGSAERVVVRVAEDAQIVAEVRKRLDALDPRPQLVARVDRDRFELAVQATRMGADHVIAADDFSTAGWRQSVRTQPTVAPERAPRAYVFVDPVSQKLLALAQRVAKAEIGVLVGGPTGAGKEVLARVLHEASPRARGPFVALNCAAMPESLIEGMLFGHEKGAFTGATQTRTGLFEQAGGGTVFLDEIGEMPYALQSRLLRVLQERELTRLGSNQVIKLDFRLIAATNRDLKAAIAAREFREDLYFRISAFRLTIPALRDRPGDILPLAAQFLVRHARELKAPAISPEAGDALLAYSWPGNVRELENVMQRALVLCGGDRVEVDHLIFDDMDDYAVPDHDLTVESSRILVGSGSRNTESPDESPRGDALESTVRASEYQAIMNAIRGTTNRNEAAARLGISPRTLRYKLARLRDPISGQSLCAFGEGVA